MPKDRDDWWVVAEYDGTATFVTDYLYEAQAQSDADSRNTLAGEMGLAVHYRVSHAPES